MLWFSLMLATGIFGLGGSWKDLWFRPRSTTIGALPRATWYELPKDMHRVATCAGLGGTWQRIS